MQLPYRLRGATIISAVLLAATAVGVHAEAPSPWVQNHRPATLWSGPDNGAVAFGQVPVWSGFQVLGGQGDRLFVQYLGNGVDREPGVAWVDQADVGPTDRPLLWIEAHQPAAVWSGPDEGAVLFGFAPPESLMVRIGPANNGRAQVFLLGNGDGHGSGVAWVELAALRAASAPPADSPLWQVWGVWDAEVAAEARRIEEERRRQEELRRLEEAARAAAVAQAIVDQPAARLLGQTTWRPISLAEQHQFIERVAVVAREFRTDTGLPPSLVIAIAINETGWGRSALSLEVHNYFGVKGHRGGGTAGIIHAQTWEVIDGEDVTILAPFRAYHSLEESVQDLGAFLRTNNRYEPVWEHAGDPEAAARALLEAGYATDPAWADKLISLMERYELRQYD